MTSILRKTYLQIRSHLNQVLDTSDARTRKAKKHILASIVIKGLIMILGFIQLPIALDYLDPSLYGIWLIFSSIITWFDFLDLGLGHGLRNTFARAIAVNDKVAARKYISTTYAILGLIMIFFFLLFLFINPYLNWTRILNTSPTMKENLALLAFVVVSSFCLRFVLKLITVILVADQRPALRDFILLVGKTITVSTLYILTKTTSGSLLILGILFSLTPILVLMAASLYFYARDYKEFIPSLKFVDLDYIRGLMNLSVKFFIIQIAYVVVFTTDNMIITQLYDPAQVTVYNVAQKYFGVITLGFQIIITPFWSSVTNAYFMNDFKWIKGAVRQLIVVWILFFFITLSMLLASAWIYRIWVPGIEVPYTLSFVMFIYVSASAFLSIFIFFINGTGKVKLQTYIAVVNMIINIPLSIFFARHLGFGITGVIMGTLVSTVIGLLLAPLQYLKLIGNRAKGIWNK